MRVVVIGGTRFMGPYLVRGLHAAGHEVTVFHRGQSNGSLPEGTRRIQGDKANLLHFQDEFKRIAPDVVIHMVLATAQDAWNMMHTFRGIAGRVIAISSADVYRAYNRMRQVEPGAPDPMPLTEESPLREKLFPYREERPESLGEAPPWIGDYDKILVERLVMSEPRLPATVLRLPAVYGPGDPQHRLFDAIKRMDDGRPAILLAEGMESWRWSHGYVENVADAIQIAATDFSSTGNIYNVSEEEPIAEAARIREIGAALGWQGAVITLPKEKLPAHLQNSYDMRQSMVLSIQKIKHDLGYSERVSRDEGLRRTIAWEREHPPQQIDAKQFDYAAEDRALATLYR